MRRPGGAFLAIALVSCSAPTTTPNAAPSGPIGDLARSVGGLLAPGTDSATGVAKK